QPELNFFQPSGNRSAGSSVFTAKANMKLALTTSIALIALLAIQNLQPRTPPPPTGRIEDTVLRTNSNEPLGGARVILTRINATTGNPIQLVGSGTSISTTGPRSPTPVPGLNAGGRGPGAVPPLNAPPPPPSVP